MNVTSDYATNINMVIPCTTNANGIPISVNSLSRNDFRYKLINHFDFCFNTRTSVLLSLSLSKSSSSFFLSL